MPPDFRAGRRAVIDLRSFTVGGASRLVTPRQHIGTAAPVPWCHVSSEGAMRRTVYSDPETIQVDTHMTGEQVAALEGLPNRLLTAFDVAEFVGCHEETVRRAYLRGLLTSQRFGVRGRRFKPADVLDWIRRGAPTKVS
jgi:excisionase family DNA binding protein